MRITRGLRWLIIGLGVVWLLGGVTRAGAYAPATTLTPRVFVPLALRVWESVPPTEARQGASDGSLTKMVNSQKGMNMFRAAGGTYNRTSVSWEQIEPTNREPQDYLWTWADRYLNPLIDNGIQPFVLILTNPEWAATSPCGPVRDPADMAQFVAALAARFPTVRYWALYNEVDNMTYPQSGHSGGCYGREDDLDDNGVPDYEDYAILMRTVWKALHAANPDAQLAFGQVSYDNFAPAGSPPWYPPGCCFNYYFLDHLFAYMNANPLPQGEKYGDVLGFNDYLLYNNVIWQRRYPEAVGVGAKAAALREVMANHGQDFPLVNTEISGDHTYEPGGISLDKQARQVTQMMVQGYFADIKTLIWWTYDDFPDWCVVHSNCYKWKFGIVDQNLDPKPSHTAFRVVGEQLDGYTPVKVRNGVDVVQFTFKRGEREKHVFYTKSEGGKLKTFRAKKLLVTDKYGVRTFYRNGVDQKIRVYLNADPIFVEINP